MCISKSFLFMNWFTLYQMQELIHMLLNKKIEEDQPIPNVDKEPM